MIDSSENNEINRRERILCITICLVESCCYLVQLCKFSKKSVLELDRNELAVAGTFEYHLSAVFVIF